MRKLSNLTTSRFNFRSIVSGTVAGYPLGVVASQFGWASVGNVFAMCGLLSAVFLGAVGTLAAPGDKPKRKKKAE
jgi:sugar phosphate permease